MELDNDQNKLVRLRDQFMEFLENENYSYREKIEELLENKQKRLTVRLDDLRKFNSELSLNLLHFPVDYLSAFQKALEKTIERIDLTKISKEDYLIGISGNFGYNQLSPRNLTASFFGKMISLEGIVTKCYELRCKVTKSVHYCKETNDQIVRYYSDLVSLSGKRTVTVYPKTDDAGNLLTTEFGLSSYEDFQKITIQEMPERAPAGQLPRSIDIILTNDLVDSVKPGDRVRISGIYRALPSKNNGSTSGVFKSVLVANYISLLLSTSTNTQLTQNDIRRIKMFANKYKGKIFPMLAMGIAPSIYGHEYIKRAILCQLMGGVEKNLENGTHIRGDINILLVGDPSTAKSQLLRTSMSLSSLSIATTGRGSSGVGLTAAVLTDMDTGEKRLEAGAMVLGDRGLVCIDEFDKMSDSDRVAIHEVMEQQTVTINKAGIHTSLNARCSVLAASNPVYGQYRRDLSIIVQENVALPDSLLSRFDLLFIVLDDIDPILDRNISEHVLSNHLFRPSNEPDGYVDPTFVFGSDSLSRVDSDSESDEDDNDDRKIFQLQKSKSIDNSEIVTKKIVNCTFLKKYMYYAKIKFSPVLSRSACKFISQSYASLRDNRIQKSLPITARTLETMIRLSSAIAKMRLSTTVSKVDSKQALDLLHFALFGEDLTVEENNSTFIQAEEEVKKYKKSLEKLKNNDDSELSSSEEERNETNEDPDNINEETSNFDFSASQFECSTASILKELSRKSDDSLSSHLPKRQKILNLPDYSSISEERVLEFQMFLSNALDSHCKKDLIVEGATKELKLTPDEIEVILSEMIKETKIYIHGNDIFRI